MSHSALLRSILFALALGMLAVELPNPAHSSHLQAQATGISVPIKVHTASLPVTIGVPFGEDDNLLDASQLGIVDSNGNPLPSQTRVLARWRGTPDDSKKLVKWLLVDFNPASTGVHFLATAPRGNFKPVTVSDTGGAWRVTNSNLDVEFSKLGERLIRGFKLDGNEMLSGPMTLQTRLPFRAIITQLGPAVSLGPDTILVTDTSLLRIGDKVHFEHTDTLKWDSAEGTARIVTFDTTFGPNRRYRIDEGTPRQEDIEVNSAGAGDLRTVSSLKFAHGTGSTIRDLSIEQETATIKNINGQMVQFTAPLKAPHTRGEKIFVLDTANQTATALVERTTIEESNELRVVVRQDGCFRSGLGKTPPTLAFALRYYIYADQPFIRVRLRMINNGTYGFGAYRTLQEPYAQHVILRSLSVLLPTTASGAGKSQVLSASEAYARILQKMPGASLSAGAFEIAVPEFAENFPKTLQGSSNGIRFDVLPELGGDYVFDGARAKTTDFYLGRGTAAAYALTSSSLASLDPAYIATTDAVRPAFVEKRDWTVEFAKDPQLAEAATRVERMLASGYAVEASESAGPVPAMSIFEYRQRGENGEQFGWRNFGDLAWGAGYANVHYDLPFVLLREYLRTGDRRAFQLGGEMARYRADWGHYRANDYVNRDHTWNFKGLAFNEKGDHGSFMEPGPSHSWIEGMWLYWALTGDEAVRESALEGADAFANMNFTIVNGMEWNEPRWVGWPTLGLIVAYRYTGDIKYLNKARANINLFLQTEEAYGRRGYYLKRGRGVNEAVQPWAWCYSLLGVIEYWRDTRDARVASFLVRVADWLVARDNNAPLKPGRALPDGTYITTGVPYYWYPDKIAEDRSLALACNCLPVLTTAAQIQNRMDLWSRANELFQHFAFYRDFEEGKNLPPTSRAVINFRSMMFPGSLPKVYGQMGLTVSDYLPGLVFYGPAPRRNPTDQSIPYITSAPEPKEPRPAVPVVTTNKLVNIAFNRPAMASSVKAWPDVIGLPSAANDEARISSGRASVWHSESNTGELEWWQVDLGKSYRISSIEIIFREDQDQATTRRNFEVRASNDLNFEFWSLLASQGEAVVPFKHSFQASINDTGTYRYVRVRKSKVDPDALGQSFFSLLEVRVFAQITEIKPAQHPQSKQSLSDKKDPMDKK
ncbi:MAG: discoidin domain-containing protein [Acidobacteria bacterium]|nr:discoidin domain-containing protein [Acidobacteriota bacterium]